MSIIGSNILAGAAGAGTGAGAGASDYQIERSLRFNSSDSAYLSRTPASASNQKTYTCSVWLKRSDDTTGRQIWFAAISTSTNYTQFCFENNKLTLYFRYNSGTAYTYTTDALFRDPSAWYHVVIAVDSAQATASDRLKIYVNGVSYSYSGTVFPQNTDTTVNSAIQHAVSSYQPYASGAYFNGYMADMYFIDGSALASTDFGEYDANNVWQPKSYSGTYGTNGFHLDFADNSTAAALGTDTSGNSNTWTVNNLSNVSGAPTSVSAASGGLPIYNTTDTYGTTKGTGTRTDSNSSSIVLAIPMDGANSGTTFTDQSATIKGSGSAKTITRYGDTITSTAQSKYYGSSGYFDGTGDYLQVANSVDLQFGTGDFTIEGWFYVSSQDKSYLSLFSLGAFTSGILLRRQTPGSDRLYINGTSYNYDQTFLPTSTWVHIALTRQSGSVNLWINGTSRLSATNTSSISPTLDLYIGTAQHALADVWNGHIQDFRIYKGVAKYTSNFNPPRSTQDATIAAGNDFLVDTPTNYGTDTGAGGEVRGNYCTFNPLAVPLSGTHVLSNGNLDVSSNAGNIIGTYFLTSGKWYWEVNTSGYVGICGKNGVGYTGSISASGSDAYGYWSNGRIYAGVGSYVTGGSTFTSSDTIGVALDMDGGTVKWYKNNVLQYNLALNYSNWEDLRGGVFPCINGGGGSSLTFTANFGARPFAYTAPSGYKALCTQNLPTPTIADGSTVMDVALYTGNGSTQTISGLGFSPDLVWNKARSSAYGHTLFDSVRGSGKYLATETTAVESDLSPNGLTSFNSNGWTESAVGGYNANGTTYVAWTWDGGSSTVSNTDGSITSSVRANASAGFSVIGWTGAASGTATIGHGLGVAPSLIITRPRNSISNWAVYHRSVGNNAFLRLNTTGASVSSSGVWGSGPSSTVFTVVQQNLFGVAGDCIAYAFAPVDGYSSFGSYTGNGSTNGTFVHTGFRPRWVMIKRSSASGSNDHWNIMDTARGTYNVIGPFLDADTSGSEVSYLGWDLLSNGFKLRNIGTSLNSSGSTYIYAAFAENPFAHARAR